MNLTAGTVKKVTGFPIIPASVNWRPEKRVECGKEANSNGTNISSSLSQPCRNLNTKNIKLVSLLFSESVWPVHCSSCFLAFRGNSYAQFTARSTHRGYQTIWADWINVREKRYSHLSSSPAPDCSQDLSSGRTTYP